MTKDIIGENVPLTSDHTAVADDHDRLVEAFPALVAPHIRAIPQALADDDRLPGSVNRRRTTHQEQSDPKPSHDLLDGFCVGFTGTRHGMTDAQKDTLQQIFDDLKKFKFRHGACRGSDEESAMMAKLRLAGQIIAHPGRSAKGGENEFLSQKALRWSNTVMPVKPFLERTRNIVNLSHLMIATPNEMFRGRRGGTNYGINYAEERGKPVIIICPDGSVELTEGTREQELAFAMIRRSITQQVIQNLIDASAQASDECKCGCHASGAMHFQACCAGKCPECGKWIKKEAKLRHFDNCGKKGL